jgi:Alpha/beta hydrolase
VTPPGAGRLADVAGWDAEELRAGVAVLAGLVDDLPSWRGRVERIGRELQDGAWSGRAGRAAAGSVFALSAVTAGVTDGLSDSLASCRRAAADAGTAAAAARASLHAAAGDTEAAEHLGELALEQAQAVREALRAANAALFGLGVSDAFTPSDFGDLAAHVLPVAVPVPPTGPDAVAVWWAGLPALAQAAFLQQRPGRAGGLDGLPSAARDRANRLRLALALRGRAPSPTARAVADVIAAHEAAGRTVQLHLFDEAGERVALGLGDADTADAVALLVPGIGTTPEDDLDAVTADVARAVDAAGAAGAGAVAGVAWLGYRPPRAGGILLRRRAAQAGPVLDAALDGMAAAREAAGNRNARATVLAHSYGTVVLDEAADAPGRLAAEAVVLLGSPGMEPGASTLEAPEVYDAASPADPISWASWFGPSPWMPIYAAEELPVAPGTGHSGYLDPGPTLIAVGGVIAGNWE